MMDDPVLSFTPDDLLYLLTKINAVELVATQLRGATGEKREARSPLARFVPVSGSVDELVLLDDSHTGVRCLLSMSYLRLVRIAAITTLAATELLGPELTTVALLATDHSARFLLAMLARHLSDIGHVALCPESLDSTAELRDLLDRTDVGLLIVDDTNEVAFGANLLVAACPCHGRLAPGHLARGTLLVNATGQDLHADLVNAVDTIIVDDTGLLEDNRQRHFVRAHLDARARTTPKPLRQTEGWHRPGLEWHNRRQVVSLGQVLTGEHPGRTHVDDVVLVELLGTRVLDIALACRLERAAFEHGVGIWSPADTTINP